MTNKKINNNFEQESGRSMVEMLGVLAIIGVLSVGGISGYTTAMNKHKANEILNAAAIRAMEVSAQIQSGVDPSTATGSVTTETIGSAEIGSAQPVGTEQFKLVFTQDVDTAVCNQMKNIAGDNSAVGVACDRLLYNNDMSAGVENKNVDSVDNEGNYTCKTVGFDPDSKCESCKTGYTGLSCNTCAEGYESDGNGCKAKQQIPTQYTEGTQGCHYCAAGSECEDEYWCSDSIYTDIDNTHIAKNVCPDTYHIATKAEVEAMLNTGMFSDGGGYWLADCDNGPCTKNSSKGAYFNLEGDVEFVDRTDATVPVLCVR